MRKDILFGLRLMSLLLSITFFIVFSITFLNEKYFIEGGKNYLSQKLQQKLVTLDSKYSGYKESHPSIAKILKNTKLNTISEKTQETLENNTDTITDRLVEGGIFLGTYFFDDNKIGIIGNEMKEKIINSVMNIKSSFLKDLRIFFFTNALGFLCIFLLCSYGKRGDIIENMFYFTLIFFSILIGGSVFYVLGQNWIENIVSNNFLGYLYPAGIILFIVSFVYFYKNPRGKKTSSETIIEEPYTENSNNIANSAKNSTLDTVYKILKIIFFPITLLLWFLEIIADIFS